MKKTLAESTSAFEGLYNTPDALQHVPGIDSHNGPRPTQLYYESSYALGNSYVDALARQETCEPGTGGYGVIYYGFITPQNYARPAALPTAPTLNDIIGDPGTIYD